MSYPYWMQEPISEIRLVLARLIRGPFVLEGLMFEHYEPFQSTLGILLS